MEQQERTLQWKRVLWTAGIVAALAFLIIVVCAYLFGWKWTGLPKQTLWDWLSLLIVPVVLALGGYLLNSAQNRATQATAEQHAQDQALQAYLDAMSVLLTDKEQPLHQAQPGDSLSSVARARTLTVLPRLGGDRKAQVVRFLYESGLILKDRPVLTLSGANLSGVKLHVAHLHGADLSEADLSGADLSGADLSGADLSEADLGKANLIAAKLRKANLHHASLPGAYLMAARLTRAKLNTANLDGAYLIDADLTGADLGTGTVSREGKSHMDSPTLSHSEGVLSIDFGHSRTKSSTTITDGTSLRGANLERASLRWANLDGIYLNGADLKGADLSETRAHRAGLEGANLSEISLNGADLREAKMSAAWGITNEGLEEQAYSLEGATMPNGQKYEDWLKSKDRKEDGENDGSS